MDAITQDKQVLEYLRTHGSMTSWEAITKFRVTRMSGVIYRLKKKGNDIDKVWGYKKNKDGKVIKKWAVYSLKK